MTALRSAQRGFVALVAAVAVTACASSPVAQAVTSEQRAYAAYGSLVIAEEGVERVTRNDSPLSDAQKLAAINAAQAARPVRDEGLALLREYQAARADFEAGAAEAGRVAAFTSRLDGWATQAEATVARVRAAMKGGAQ